MTGSSAAAARGRSAAGPPPAAWSRRDAWAWGSARLRRASRGAAAFEAEVLLRHAAGLSRTELLARPEAPVAEAEAARYREWIGRREDAVPVAYLIGTREFCGLEFAVDPRVLVPRPETERLVDVLAQHLASPRREGRGPQCAADIGTGSGAIAVALASAVPDLRMLATDISHAALDVARSNGRQRGVGARITWACGRALVPLAALAPPAGFDAIVSNPPYIPTAEVASLPAEIRDHEPRSALDGGTDGLDVHRAIIAGAASYLAPGGALALEVAALWDQANAVVALIAQTGAFDAPRIIRDHGGVDRVVMAVRRDDGHHRR